MRTSWPVNGKSERKKKSKMRNDKNQIFKTSLIKMTEEKNS